MPPGAFDSLPTALREIAEVAGLQAALKVAEVRGGTRVSIPRQPGPNHWLTVAVGQAHADAIARHFAIGGGGVKMEIPVGPSGTVNRQLAIRRGRMAAMVDEDLSADRIAGELGITRRSVQRFRAKAKATDDKQGNLF